MARGGASMGGEGGSDGDEARGRGRGLGGGENRGKGEGDVPGRGLRTFHRNSRFDGGSGD